MERRHLRILAMLRRLAAMCVVAILAAVAGCAMSKDPIVEATATLSPDVLQHGELYQVHSGGIIWIGDVSIPFAGVETYTGQPVAAIAFGTKRDLSLGSSDIRLHLGESVTYPGLGTITLVSFDKAKGWSVQAITLLVDLEDQPAPTGAPT